MRRRPPHLRWAASAAWVLLAACGGGPLDNLGEAENVVDSGYIIEPPGGYVRCTVSVPSGLEITNADDASLHVYADASLADPYQGPLYGLASFPGVELQRLPLGDTVDLTVKGVPARLGPISGFQLAELPDAAGLVLTWVEGDRMIQLAGRDIPEDQLLSAAQSVALDDGAAIFAADELPSGFVALGDVYAREGQARFRFAVEFQLPAVDVELVEDNLTLLGSEGDAEAMEAFRFRAARSSRIQVNGRPALSARSARTVRPASWHGWSRTG